jgi:hypothetical protein
MAPAPWDKAREPDGDVEAVFPLVEANADFLGVDFAE